MDAADERQLLRRCSCGLPLTSHHLAKSPQCAESLFPADSASPLRPSSLALNSVARTFHDSQLRSAAANELMDLREQHGLNETVMKRIKTMHTNIRRVSAIGELAALRPYLRDGVSAEDILPVLERNAFADLETTHQEMQFAKQTLPVLEPRKVELSKNHTVCSFDISQLIERQLRHDAAFRRRSSELNDKLKSGEWHQVEAEEVEDIMQGAAVRWHAECCRKADDNEEVEEFRVPLILQADDLEVWHRRLTLCQAGCS